MRKSLERDYRQAFTKNILPFMGNLEINSVSVDTLESFRFHLVEERKLALKTARNIIDGSLRAMFRDAGRRLERNPFIDSLDCRRKSQTRTLKRNLTAF